MLRFLSLKVPNSSGFMSGLLVIVSGIAPLLVQK